MSRLQEELEFEQNEKFMLLALEQFVPTISAVNSVISICDSSFSTFNSAIKELSAVKIWGDAINASDEEKERIVEVVRSQDRVRIHNLFNDLIYKQQEYAENGDKEDVYKLTKVKELVDDLDKSYTQNKMI